MQALLVIGAVFTCAANMAYAGATLDGTRWSDGGDAIYFVAVMGTTQWWGESTADVYITYSWSDAIHDVGGSGEDVYLGEVTLSPGEKGYLWGFPVSYDAWQRGITGSWKIVWYVDGGRYYDTGSF